MATQYFGAGMFSVILLLVFITSQMAEVDAANLKLSFGNVMQQAVSIHCHSDHADLGQQTIGTNIGWYSFTILNSDTTGDEYWCQYESAGKPSTYTQVFVGKNAVDNMPCRYPGSECIWIIEDKGISCNLDKYYHPWSAVSRTSAKFDFFAYF